jgi:hypothetical protein
MLLAAACAGGSGSLPKASGTGSAPTSVQRIDAFAQCVRPHGGYPNFPDPTMSHGHPVLLPAAGTDTSSPQFQAAVRTCA